MTELTEQQRKFFDEMAAAKNEPPRPRVAGVGVRHRHGYDHVAAPVGLHADAHPRLGQPSPEGQEHQTRSQGGRGRLGRCCVDTRAPVAADGPHRVRGGQGQNRLGVLLMERRSLLIERSKP